LLDESYYLEQNPDVAATGRNPLLHYLLAGAAEGRNPNEFFDTGFYLFHNPDVVRAGVNPLAHYLRAGAREGRDPSPHFNTKYYVASNPETGTMNPLVHFLRFGLKQKRPGTMPEWDRWAEEYDMLADDQLAAMQKDAEKLPAKPFISIIMPVYNTPENYLRAALQSVHDQVYGNWELCIADDASTAPHVRPILEEWPRKDNRVRVVYRAENGHISAASNSALELAGGDYVALMDHDDLLTPDALFRVAEEINRHPAADIIYSDEDGIDVRGNRMPPYFKPDWNPDLLLSQNYMCHLSVFRHKLVRDVGGFRHGVEGSQDWDLALRISERTTPDRIRHIPRILYHWRRYEGTVSADLKANTYVLDSSRKTLEDALKRRSINGEVLPTAKEYWRIRYPVPEPRPTVSIIIPTRNRHDLLRQCIDSIRAKTDYAPYEIIVVDNHSDDPATLAYLAGLTTGGAERVLKYGPEFNFSAICNYAAGESEADIIVVVNNDTEVIDGDWLREMVSHAVRPGIGAVGARLLYPDNRIQHAGVVLGIGGVAGHAFRGLPLDHPCYFNRGSLVQNYSALTAACLAIKRSTYLAMGGMDEEHLQVAYNDVDLCMRLRDAGYRNVFTPFVLLYHHESASRGYEDTDEKRIRHEMEVLFMQHKWGDALTTDPAYNPNLSLYSEHFALAFPPRCEYRAAYPVAGNSLSIGHA